MVDRVDVDREARREIEERWNRKEIGIPQKEINKITIEKGPLKNLLIENKYKISENDNIITPLKNFKLNELNPDRWERPEINGQFNRFIEEQFARIEHNARNIQQDQVPEALPRPKDSFHSRTGLTADVLKSLLAHSRFTVKGRQVVSEGEQFTDIHFTPEGRNFFERSQMTASLANGIQGITELMDAIDRGEVKMSPIFIGSTNIHMALIAQRLGFKIVDQCRTADGNINKDRQGFVVVGILPDIKSRVEEFRRSGVSQKLTQRSQRLRLKPSAAR